MPSKVLIDRELKFLGAGNLKDNVVGALKEKKRHTVYRFGGIAIDSTNDWSVSVPGTSDTVAISETTGGSALITTGTADNDSCMMSTAIIYEGDQNGEVEARITIDNVSGIGLFFGFSDAKSESNNSLALHYPADSFTSDATDAAGFVVDADHESSLIMCASTQTAGGDTTPVSSGVTWTDGQTKTLRVRMLPDDNVQFLLDGATVAQIPSSITSATLMCVTFQAITRNNEGSETIRVHSVDTWQDD